MNNSYNVPPIFQFNLATSHHTNNTTTVVNTPSVTNHNTLNTLHVNHNHTNHNTSLLTNGSSTSTSFHFDHTLFSSSFGYSPTTIKPTHYTGGNQNNNNNHNNGSLTSRLIVDNQSKDLIVHTSPAPLSPRVVQQQKQPQQVLITPQTYFSAQNKPIFPFVAPTFTAAPVAAATTTPLMTTTTKNQTQNSVSYGPTPGLKLGAPTAAAVVTPIVTPAFQQHNTVTPTVIPSPSTTTNTFATSSTSSQPNPTTTTNSAPSHHATKTIGNGSGSAIQPTTFAFDFSAFKALPVFEEAKSYDPKSHDFVHYRQTNDTNLRRSDDNSTTKQQEIPSPNLSQQQDQTTYKDESAKYKGLGEEAGTDTGGCAECGGAPDNNENKDSSRRFSLTRTTTMTTTMMTTTMLTREHSSSVRCSKDHMERQHHHANSSSGDSSSDEDAHSPIKIPTNYSSLVSSEVDLLTLKQAFNLFDRNGDGKISLEELEYVLLSLRLISHQDVMFINQQFHNNAHQRKFTIDFYDFLALLKPAPNDLSHRKGNKGEGDLGNSHAHHHQTHHQHEPHFNDSNSGTQDGYPLKNEERRSTLHRRSSSIATTSTSSDEDRGLWVSKQRIGSMPAVRTTKSKTTLDNSLNGSQTARFRPLVKFTKLFSFAWRGRKSRRVQDLSTASSKVKAPSSTTTTNNSTIPSRTRVNNINQEEDGGGAEVNNHNNWETESVETMHTYVVPNSHPTKFLSYNNKDDIKRFKSVPREERTMRLNELSSVFNVFDADNDGFISNDELRQVMNELGMSNAIGDDEVVELFRLVGREREGLLSFHDFITLFSLC